jgi:hypothetical protein
MRKEEAVRLAKQIAKLHAKPYNAETCDADNLELEELTKTEDDRQALITRLELESNHCDLHGGDYGRTFLAPLLREAAVALAVHDTVNQPESVNIDERGIRHVIVGGERVTDQRLAALTGPKNWPDYCWNHDTNRVNCGCEGPTPEGREMLRTAKVYAVITEMRRKVGTPDDRDAKSVWSWRLDEWADTLAALTGDTEEKP